MVRFTVDNRNRLVFYGNMVGYVKDNTAVVDEMFQTDELTRYLTRLNLTPQWEEGVFDRLTAGEVPGEELGQPQKGCRIWQLRKDVDVTMRFIGYEDLVKKFGEPDADNYTQVFDGDLGTNDLEQIYAWNPEIILLNSFSAYTPEDILNSTAGEGQDWSGIQAVQDGQVFKFPLGVYYWFAPCSDSPLALQWVAKTLYPELFEDVDLDQVICDYYSEYYGIELTQDDLATLYAPPAESAMGK